SPGGWNIIGRTTLALWNANLSNPALFSAGDSVRFAQTESLEAHSAASSPHYSPASPAFRVIKSGAYTTVQDFGRPGFGSLGLTEGGTYDREAAVIANALVGNAPDLALLEMIWGEVELLALQTLAIALVGRG